VPQGARLRQPRAVTRTEQRTNNRGSNRSLGGLKDASSRARHGCRNSRTSNPAPSVSTMAPSMRIANREPPAMRGRGGMSELAPTAPPASAGGSATHVGVNPRGEREVSREGHGEQARTPSVLSVLAARGDAVGQELRNVNGPGASALQNLGPCVGGDGSLPSILLERGQSEGQRAALGPAAHARSFKVGGSTPSQEGRGASHAARAASATASRRLSS
jgi:hypothetical protein